MSEIEVRPAEDLVLPLTGEIIDRTDPQACAKALMDIRALDEQMKAVKAALTQALIEHSHVVGSKTIQVAGGYNAIISGGKETVYDAMRLEQELREAGLPEERIGDLVKTEVSYRVLAGEAKRLASANPQYAAVIERCSQQVEKTQYVSIRKR